MVTINSICIGNKEESFYLDNFSKGVNIIHGTDNNKGKTILLQGIMFAFGNSPTFPEGFDYKNYYFILELNKNGKSIFICRKNSHFLVFDSKLSSFDYVKDFEKYFNDNICSLPMITERGIKRTAGLELFFEMVFLPQDKRQTSNIFNKGRYNKFDYIECIYSLMNCDYSFNLEQDDIEEIKNEIRDLETEKKILIKKNKFIKSNKKEAIFTTYTASKSLIDGKLKEIEECNNAILKLNKERTKLFKKQLKNEELLTEIKSLKPDKNDFGKYVCLNCGSDKILYVSPRSNIKFEISDDDMRKEIIKIIESRIQFCKESILDLDSKIVSKKQELSELMMDDAYDLVKLENVIFYKNEINAAQQIDKKIFNIDQSIQNLKDKINKLKQTNDKNEALRNEIYSRFIQIMNDFYRTSEPEDNLPIEDIFTKNTVTRSGSQGTLYLMSRIYACSVLLNIDFPIIIDSLRGEEISSLSEERVIDLFYSLNKQTIFTCTLKKEEANKYLSNVKVNAISFASVNKHKLLQKKDNQKFRELLQKFSINIDIQ